ncbi:MAG: GIY-YIG nuclease family protein [Firmicutes bacterium]|nr:GIY-YIG nuclease family protein [Bacillota bacterium]
MYIVRCADGTLYTGSTIDVARRLKQHQAGRASRYTRARLPVELCYVERVDGWSAALVRESAIKRLSRADKEQLVRCGGSGAQAVACLGRGRGL